MHTTYQRFKETPHTSTHFLIELQVWFTCKMQLEVIEITFWEWPLRVCTHVFLLDELHKSIYHRLISQMPSILCPFSKHNCSFPFGQKRSIRGIALLPIYWNYYLGQLIKHFTLSLPNATESFGWCILYKDSWDHLQQSQPGRSSAPQCKKKQ